VISGEAAALLWDARRASDLIASFTTGRSYQDYLKDDMLRSAVERQFEIVGEAFAALRRVAPAIADQIPDLRQVIAFRNVLIHGYAGIQHRVVWDAVEEDLPRLRAVLEKLLQDAPPP
jgi:uncharacterized protein with HEPN domain